MITTMKEAEELIYQSYLRAYPHLKELLDQKVRLPQLTRKLLTLLGNPDTGQKIVLVTGSKGKGSTAKFIASLLQHHGLKVGLFTSPHLVHFNERIRINGSSITNEEFIRLSNVVYGPVMEIENELYNEAYLGPIGICLSIALLFFKENKTDINIIECGRGGRFDDTNVLQNEWAVITPIMDEHLANLGPSIKEITDHKLGIIKERTEHVFISKQTEAQELVIELLRKKANVFFYNENFGANNITISSKGTSFTVWTDKKTYKTATIPLLGSFQAINAATSVKVCETILQSKMDDQLLVDCFRSLQWPGRCEVVDQDPLVILDGAINEATATYTKEALCHLQGRNIVSIIGVPANKDYQGVIKVANDFSHTIIITKPDITHLPFDEKAFEFAKSICKNSISTGNLQDALVQAKRLPETDIIVIMGTQTLIGNAKRLLEDS